MNALTSDKGNINPQHGQLPLNQGTLQFSCHPHTFSEEGCSLSHKVNLKACPTIEIPILLISPFIPTIPSSSPLHEFCFLCFPNPAQGHTPLTSVHLSGLSFLFIFSKKTLNKQRVFNTHASYSSVPRAESHVSHSGDSSMRASSCCQFGSYLVSVIYPSAALKNTDVQERPLELSNTEIASSIPRVLLSSPCPWLILISSFLPSWLHMDRASGFHLCSFNTRNQRVLSPHTSPFLF